MADMDDNTSKTMEHRRIAVLERFLEAWNGRDVDGLMACMADDCAFNASSGPDADASRGTTAAM
jgi:hypothetical protein